MAEITLSHPVSVDDLREAFPRALLASADVELARWLDIEERALRSQYGVTALTQAADGALADAMIFAWPSFQQQVRNIAQESASPDGHSVTYAQAQKDKAFTFPSALTLMLGPFADEGSAAPSTTELVR